MNEKMIYEGHLKLVRREHLGHEFDVVVSQNAAAIMYIDPEDCVYFTKQFRVPLQKDVLELPAEILDKPGKTSLEVIVEGLEEECGIKINAQQAI
jgi:ADP-ribose pyrophosphatase